MGWSSPLSSLQIQAVRHRGVGDRAAAPCARCRRLPSVSTLSASTLRSSVPRRTSELALHIVQRAGGCDPFRQPLRVHAMHGVLQRAATVRPRNVRRLGLRQREAVLHSPRASRLPLRSSSPRNRPRTRSSASSVESCCCEESSAARNNRRSAWRTARAARARRAGPHRDLRTVKPNGAMTFCVATDPISKIGESTAALVGKSMYVTIASDEQKPDARRVQGQAIVPRVRGHGHRAQLRDARVHPRATPLPSRERTP